ncbi:MAG: hypothetical protein U0835_00965 [Isosphaeraceae bacterium]
MADHAPGDGPGAVRVAVGLVLAAALAATATAALAADRPSQEATFTTLRGPDGAPDRFLPKVLKVSEANGPAFRMTRYSVVANRIEGESTSVDSVVGQGGLLSFRLVWQPGEEGPAAQGDGRLRPAPLVWRGVEWLRTDREAGLRWGGVEAVNPAVLDVPLTIALSKADADLLLPPGRTDSEASGDAPVGLRCQVVAIDHGRLSAGLRATFRARREAVKAAYGRAFDRGDGKPASLQIGEEGDAEAAWVRDLIGRGDGVSLDWGPDAAPSAADLALAHRAVFAALRAAWLDYGLAGLEGRTRPTALCRWRRADGPDSVEVVLSGAVPFERYVPIDVETRGARWQASWVRRDDFARSIEQRVVFFLAGDWPDAGVRSLAIQAEVADPSIGFETTKVLTIDVAELLKTRRDEYVWTFPGRNSRGLTLRWRLSAAIRTPGNRLVRFDRSAWTSAPLAPFEDAVYLLPGLLADAAVPAPGVEARP